MANFETDLKSKSDMAPLYEELRKPSTIMGIMIAVLELIIGTAISAYFYYKSVNVGKLYYYTHQVLAFDQNVVSGNAGSPPPPLMVVDGRGERIHDNVYVATIKFWNGGSDEIKTDDIRTPFEFFIPQSANIIRTTIDYATRKNADQFSISNNRTIHWNHFDLNEGFLIRIIYISHQKHTIAVSGYSSKVHEAINTDNINALQSSRAFILQFFIGTLAIFATIFHYSRLENNSESFLMI